MSVTLTWRRIACGTRLPDALRRILEEHRMQDPRRVWKVSQCEDGDYFSGLANAGVDGAQEVLDALEDHGSIILELGY